jgi:hypothetical protein
MAAVVPSYKGFRYPVEVVSHYVWLYHRFPLSLRDVEEMMAERGVSVSYDTIHQWCRKFGQTYATDCAAAGLDQATSGMSTRCLSRLEARLTTYGARWTSTGTCWTSWSPPTATLWPPPGSFVSCSKDGSTCPGFW